MSNPAAPDISQFITHVELLTKWDRMHIFHEKAQPVILVQPLPDNKELRAQRYIFSVAAAEVLEDLCKSLAEENAKGYGISMAVHEYGWQGDFSVGRKKENISRVRAQVVDVDSYLPKKAIQAAIALWKPSWVVATSVDETGQAFKTHWYWRYEYEEVDEKFLSMGVTNTNESKLLEKFDLLQEILAYKCQKDLELITDRQIKVDSSINISKMLRCPGFLHQKHEDRPFLVQIAHIGEPLEECGITCTDDGITEFFERMGVDDETITAVKNKQYAKRRSIRRDDINALIDIGFKGYEEGDRHTELFSYVDDLILHRHLSREEALILAIEANLKNTPPLGEHEVENIVESVFEHKVKSLSKSGLRQAAKRETSAIKFFEKKIEKIRNKVEDINVGAEEDANENEIPDDRFIYDYDNDAHFAEVLSDTSIIYRVYQRWPELIKYSAAQGTLIYNADKGIFEADESSISNLINKVIVGMQYEDVVHAHFTFQKKTKNAVTGEDIIESCLDNRKMMKYIEGKRSANARRGIFSMLPLVDEFKVDVRDWDKDDNLLCVKNGVLNLETMELGDFSPEHKMTMQCEGRFDGDLYEKMFEVGKATDEKAWVEGGIWTKFIWEIMQGDLELCRFLQTIAGYVLSGSLDQQVLFFMYGLGANGKSTFAETLIYALGSYGSVASNALVVQKPGSAGIEDNNMNSELARLVGKRGVLAREVQDGQVLSENAIKDITTGTEITARHLHKNQFTYVPKFTLLLHGNSKPTIKGNTDGIWRRIVTIPFDAKFKETEQNKKLKVELRRSEVLSEIISWAAAGYKMLSEVGHLVVPEKCSELKREYREEMHPTDGFIEEVLLHTREKAWTLCSDVYDMYVFWCKSKGYEAMHKSWWGRKFAEKKIKSKCIKNNGDVQKFYPVLIKPEWKNKFELEGGDELVKESQKVVPIRSGLDWLKQGLEND